MKKDSITKRIMSYNGHTIYMCKLTNCFLVALDRNGTDRHFKTLVDAMSAIDEYNDAKRGL